MKLRIELVTYNIATTAPSPTETLHSLLATCHDDSEPTEPDIYVIGLQEVSAKPQDLFRDSVVGEPWTEHVQQVLQARDYVQIKSTRLQGLLLVVFAQRRHLFSISNVEANYTRTGLMGFWGNKGGVSIRLDFSGCSICFINAHLSAHENKVKARINDYKMIVSDHKSCADNGKDIYSHNYVFWMGDLNFRFSKDCNKSFSEIITLINEGKSMQLMQYDELKNVMVNNQAFKQLKEEFPKFPPTFKFKIGTDTYNTKRLPAWTDRILFKPILPKNNPKNLEIKHVEGSYRSHDQYKLSDHKPVTSSFIVKIPTASTKMDSRLFSRSVITEELVIFENVSSWENDEVNSFFYTIKTSSHLDDWIGVYFEGFSNFNEYITYEYVSNCAQTQTDPKLGKGVTRYKVDYSKLPIHVPKNKKICIIYFQQTRGNSTQVLGISNYFDVKYKKQPCTYYINNFL